MAVLRAPTPQGLKEAFERAGYRVLDEDEYTWLMARGDNDVPIPIPKKGHRIAGGVVDALVHSPFSDSRLRKEILRAVSQDATIPDPPEN